MMSNIDRNSRFFPTEIIQELRYDRGKTVKGKNMSKDRRQEKKKPNKTTLVSLMQERQMKQQKTAGKCKKGKLRIIFQSEIYFGC